MAADGNAMIGGGVHIFPLRVYYEDTDAGGVVYYANYLRFAERARTEMLRQLGFSWGALIDGEGISFAVRHCAADYLRPARLDDALEVHTEISEVGGASLKARQTVKLDNLDITRLDVRLACMGRNGEARRIPAGLRRALENFHQPREQD